MAKNGEDSKVVELTLPDSFLKLYETIRKQHPQHTIDTLSQRLLAIDPGETCGLCEYAAGKLLVFQKATKEIGPSYVWLDQKLKSLESYGHSRAYNHIRCEDYKVYSWKTDDHAFASLHTAQLIGAIRACAYQNHVPISLKMAQQAKQWWDDEKLYHFGLYPVGLKHGRDALRHMLYYILFPN